MIRLIEARLASKMHRFETPSQATMTMVREQVEALTKKLDELATAKESGAADDRRS